MIYLFIYLFIGCESKRTYMSDGFVKKWEISAMLREYMFYMKYGKHSKKIYEKGNEICLFSRAEKGTRASSSKVAREVKYTRYN